MFARRCCCFCCFCVLSAQIRPCVELCIAARLNSSRFIGDGRTLNPMPTETPRRVQIVRLGGVCRRIARVEFARGSTRILAFEHSWLGGGRPKRSQASLARIVLKSTPVAPVRVLLTHASRRTLSESASPEGGGGGGGRFSRGSDCGSGHGPECRHPRNLRRLRRVNVCHADRESCS